MILAKYSRMEPISFGAPPAVLRDIVDSKLLNSSSSNLLDQGGLQGLSDMHGFHMAKRS